MKIFKRRNAMLGWATWKAAKGIAKYQQGEEVDPETRGHEEDIDEEEEGREGHRGRGGGRRHDRRDQAQAQARQ